MNDSIARLSEQLSVAADPRLVAKTNFVVPHTWPNIKNAESEVIQRLARAATNIGCTMIVTDNDGYPIWSNREVALDGATRIDAKRFDFMISLHFESPKLIDVFSYYAVWQPLDFYFSFGYHESVEKILTHNACLSCRSNIADIHIENLFRSIRPDHDPHYDLLFHSPPEPYLTPNITGDARLFYVGVNWERLGGKKGRHHRLLSMLDRAGLIDIYGPKELLGSKPWEGYESYRGELPFDGKSVVHAINRSGICLALSSDAHKRTGLMSNRLFEGLAAGAAVVAESNSFVDTYFSDVVYYVDDSNDDDLFEQIRSIIEGIRRDPTDAIERAKLGQQRLEEAFSLEKCLGTLIASHDLRAQRRHSNLSSNETVTIIVTYFDEVLDDLLELLRTIVSQVGVTIDIELICDSEFYETHRSQIAAFVRGRCRRFTGTTGRFRRYQRAGDQQLQLQPTGPIVAKLLSELTTDFFCFVRHDEEWFRDHLAAILNAMRCAGGAVMGVSGALVEELDAEGRERRRVQSVRFDIDLASLLSGRYVDEVGRFVFSRSVLAEMPQLCLSLLDGQEPNLLRIVASLRGEPAESGYASYVRKATRSAMLPGSSVPVEQQQQFIRDALAGNSQWLSMVKRSVGSSPYRLANQSREAIRQKNSPYPTGVVQLLHVDQLYDTCAEGPGINYLAHGFSAPGRKTTLIEAQSGVLEFSLYDDEIKSETEYDLVLAFNRQRGAGQRRCSVAVNGIFLQRVEVPTGKALVRIPLSRTLLEKAKWVRVHVSPHSATSAGINAKSTNGNLRLRRFGLINSAKVQERKRKWWQLFRS